MHNRRVIVFGHGTQVRARSRELICFGEHDPRALRIDFQGLVVRRRDLDGILWAVRRAVCNGEDRDFLLPVVDQNRSHDGAGEDVIVIGIARSPAPEVLRV